MGPIRRRSASILLLAIALQVVVTGVVVEPVAAQSTGLPDQPDADNTATQVELYENGSARWTIHVRTRLDTAQDLERYRTFQEQFRAERTTYLEPFSRRMRRVVAGAANATDRPMSAEGFATSTSIQEIPRRWGIVTFEFTWVGFAERSGGGLVVGDVFEGGFFLAANDSLTITAPPGDDIAAVEPPVERRGNGSVTWVGRLDFADGQPRVETVPAGGTTDSRAGTPADAGAGPLQGAPAVLVGGVIVVLLLAAGLVLARRRRERSGTTSPTGPSTDGPRLATDEDRVVELLEAHGGRMRQADIATELDWSTSKTSRVLASMVDDGAVEKLRLGRENVIDLVEDEE